MVNGDKCIWWYREYRHWWIGPCENVGTNSGYAYIYPDVRCPSPSYGSKWTKVDWTRDDESGEPLEGVEQRYSRCIETFDKNGNENGLV